MSQSAKAIYNIPTLSIFEFIRQKVKSFNEPKQVPQPVPTYNDNPEIDKLIKWLSNNEYVNGIQYTQIPAGQLYLNNRLVITFTLREKFSSNFILLRGLFEFGKPSGILISANKTTQTFTIDVLANQVLNSHHYIDATFKWLAKEIKFRTTLRELLQLQEETKIKESIAFGNLQRALA